MAAFFHGVVEISGVTQQDLTEQFGSDAAAFVGVITDDKTLPKAEREWLQVVYAPKKSVLAQMIKLAEKISCHSEKLTGRLEHGAAAGVLRLGEAGHTESRGEVRRVGIHGPDSDFRSGPPQRKSKGSKPYLRLSQARLNGLDRYWPLPSWNC